MKLFDLIEQLENIYEKHGNIEVTKVYDYVNKDEEINADVGYVSCTGQAYSKYDFDHFPEDYPEKDEFDLEKDLVCIL